MTVTEVLAVLSTVPHGQDVAVVGRDAKQQIACTISEKEPVPQGWRRTARMSPSERLFNQQRIVWNAK